MSKVSVNILTKNRKDQLAKAIESVLRQSFKDVEIVIVNDGSNDNTQIFIESLKQPNIKAFHHKASVGITNCRQEALQASAGEYIAILDDDDEWIDAEKLAKQVKYLDDHPEAILVGGGIQITNFEFRISPPAKSRIINYNNLIVIGKVKKKLSAWRAGKQIPNPKSQTVKLRPQTDGSIRNWMLLKNPFFTSTVMFRRESAIKAGGFVKDEIDLAEDYDLWLRMGTLGKMYNFPEAFTLYSKPQYNKEKLLKFFNKQAILIAKQKKNYPFYFLSKIILMLRIKFYALFF